MSEPLLAKICVTVFVLCMLPLLSMTAMRLLSSRERAMVELGFGPKLFFVDLNHVRYQINLVPAFVCKIGLTRTVGFRWTVADLLTSTGLLLLAAGFVGAGLWAARRESARSGAATARASEAFAFIEEVEPDSPAARAGLTVGAAIRRLNGASIESGLDLLTAYGHAAEEVEFEVLPGGDQAAPLRVTVKREKAHTPLGLTCVTSSSPPAGETAAAAFIVRAIAGAGRDAWRFIWGNPRGYPAELRVRTDDFFNLNLFINGAVVSLIFSLLILFRAFFLNAHALWLAALFSLAQGLWLPLGLAALVLAFYYFVEEHRYSVTLMICSLSLLFATLTGPHHGLAQGLLTRVAQENHLPLFWTF